MNWLQRFDIVFGISTTMFERKRLDFVFKRLEQKIYANLNLEGGHGTCKNSNLEGMEIETFLCMFSNASIYPKTMERTPNHLPPTYIRH